MSSFRHTPARRRSSVGDWIWACLPSKAAFARMHDKDTEQIRMRMEETRTRRNSLRDNASPLHGR